MHLDIIPSTTALARAILLKRDALPRNHGQFLKLLDGRTSLRDLSGRATQLGIDSGALAAMVNAGLMGWQRN
jgi:hypothetical protein